MSALFSPASAIAEGQKGVAVTSTAVAATQKGVSSTLKAVAATSADVAATRTGVSSASKAVAVILAGIAATSKGADIAIMGGQCCLASQSLRAAASGWLSPLRFGSGAAEFGKAGALPSGREREFPTRLTFLTLRRALPLTSKVCHPAWRRFARSRWATQVASRLRHTRACLYISSISDKIEPPRQRWPSGREAWKGAWTDRTRASAHRARPEIGVHAPRRAGVKPNHIQCPDYPLAARRQAPTHPARPPGRPSCPLLSGSHHPTSP